MEPSAPPPSSAANAPAAAGPITPIPADLWDIEPAVPSGRSYVVMVGAPGDWVSGGESYLYTNLDARITVSETMDGNRQRLGVGVEGEESWSGAFAGAPDVPLDVGYYPDATPSPSTHTQVKWSGEGRGCDGDSWMAVDELTRAVDGTITELTLRFAQTCYDGPTLYGKVRYLASDRSRPPGVVSPAPGGLWDVNPGLPAGRTWAVVDGTPGDGVSDGTNQLYTQADAAISVTGRPDSVRVVVLGDEYWVGAFRSAYVDGTLRPGYYANAGDGDNPARPSVVWVGRTSENCAGSTGWMVVDEITRSGDEVTSLTLRFELTCPGKTPMHGKVHWVKSDATTPPGPVKPVPAGLWDVTPVFPEETYVYLDGSPQDRITGGIDRRFPFVGNQSDLDLSIVAQTLRLQLEHQGIRYDGVFTTMASLDQLEEGFYSDLQDVSRLNPAKGGFYWRPYDSDKIRECGNTTGWVAIDHLVRSSGAIIELTMRFEQTCEGATPLRGKIHYVSEVPDRSPVGAFDSAVAEPGGVRVTGWAIDPDVAYWIRVMASVDGAETQQILALDDRPDVTAAFPGYATTGFNVVIPMSPGAHTVCLRAQDEGTSGDTSLGCRRVVVPGSSPFGSLDLVAGRPGAIDVAGWTIDPDTRAPIDVHLYVDAASLAVTASGSRPDVGAAFPDYGSDHGYTVRLNAAPGTHQVCAYGINVATGTNSLLGCRRVVVPGGSPFGSLDLVAGRPGAIDVAGWTIDPDTRAPIDVHLYVDAASLAVTASGSRPDVGAAFPDYGSDHGYTARLNAAPGTHQVCAYGINVATGTNSLLGCRRVVVPGGSPFGSLDLVAGRPGAIDVAGWTIDPDTRAPIDVHLYVDAASLAVTASGSRPDVGAAFPDYGSDHGYTARLNAAPGTHQVCAYGINVATGTNSLLGCRSVTIA